MSTHAYIAGIILFLVKFSILSGQNLVPNPGFEEYLENPDFGPSGINSAPAWFTLSGTPDFYHIEYPFPNAVPANFRGTQEPASGDGYAGIISFTANHRELLGVELTRALEPEKVYQVSFKVSLSGRSKFATDDIGAVLLKGTRDSIMVKSMSVRNDEGNIIEDTISWITISGKYLAEGGEHILGIGNFDSGDGKMIRAEGDGWAYFFIDDVEVIEACPDFSLERKEVEKRLCEGTTFELQGIPDAESYNWVGRHTFRNLVAREAGEYTVNSYFDCSIVQTRFQVQYEPCDCTLNIPSIINQVNQLEILPAQNVISFEFYLVDTWGRPLYQISSDGEEGGFIPEVSAPYFWRARMTCIAENDQIIEQTKTGKLMVQN